MLYEIFVWIVGDRHTYYLYIERTEVITTELGKYTYFRTILGFLIK